MKKIAIRCWKDVAACECGKVAIYYTVPDYGDAAKLFICLHCATIFAVDPDTEYYSKVPFERLKRSLSCESCGYSLKDVVPYPATFLCPDSLHRGSYTRFDRTIPPDETSVVMEFWNPYDS